MIPRVNSRIPLFEGVLLLMLVAMGWAAFHTHTVLNRWEHTSPARSRETHDIQDILKLQALNDVKDRYLALADQLESGLAEMRDSLRTFLREKDRTEIGRYLRRGQALEGWLRKQRDDQDGRKLQTLRDWLASLPGTGTNSASLLVDLDAVFPRVEHSFSNYLNAIQITEGQTLSLDLVEQKLARAAEPEQELLTMAAKARAQARALEVFVEHRPGQRATLPPHESGTGPLSVPAETRASLQALFYALTILVIAQCAMLMVALYGRVVVAPLRQKLIEDTAAVEHQKKLDHFSRLSTSLAHEIRNPLTAINVRLFSLQKGMDKGTSEHGDATLIRNEIDRLEQTLKNFLKLARPADPKFALLTAGPLLREVRELLAPQLQQQEIEISIEGGTDIRFRADPVQLKQVLINLIHNAADSIGRKGSIVLRAAQRDLRTSGQLIRMLVIEVEDTGPGIIPEVQERLFDPFYSTKENGTGLGLPIAAKIVEQHKGMLDFDTRLGQGTTFRVILPVSQ